MITDLFSTSAILGAAMNLTVVSRAVPATAIPRDFSRRSA
jgi:hypothetical protein